MGTRGFTGLVIDGEEKIGYQQYDSYPSGVGASVLAELRVLVKDLDGFKEKARALRVVSDETAPTPADVDALASVTNLGVSTGSTDDWYCLLRETQGSIQGQIDCGYVEDNHLFPLDSLFCEYGYLVDLDAETFEVYEGFQKEPSKEGRWAGKCETADGKQSSDYWAVERIAVYPLSALPNNEDFLKLEESEDDDE